MLVNAADMLKKAEAGKYGLGAFNTNNLEWTLAILQAAEEAKSPLILQYRSRRPSPRSRFLRGLLQVHRGRLHVHHV